MQLTRRERDRDPFSRHILPPFPAGGSAVLFFPGELAVITGVFLYPNLQRSRPDSPLSHAHGNIFWRVARHQPANKLINPTCLTTTCQALHQRRSVAAAKGQSFSNSRGAGAWTQQGGSKFCGEMEAEEDRKNKSHTFTSANKRAAALFFVGNLCFVQVNIVNQLPLLPFTLKGVSDHITLSSYHVRSISDQTPSIPKQFIRLPSSLATSLALMIGHGASISI